MIMPTADRRLLEFAQESGQYPKGLGGKRWYRCEKCGKVGPADEFAVGDVGGVWNRGVCCECA